MTLFETAALLLTLSALFGWVNHYFFHLPRQIGLLVMGLVASLLLIAAELIFPSEQLYEGVAAALTEIDFTQIVFNGMLAFLLFAGALNVNFSALWPRLGPVAALALLGTLISTFLVGTMLWGVGLLLHIPLRYEWALVFGAVISPTDPVAVLAMLKGVALPERLRVDVEGEALFNDGIGIVLFTVLVGIAIGFDTPSALEVSWELVREVAGGLLLGLLMGYLAYRAMRAIDDFPVEILITLALVGGTYALAQRIGVSGPLATVAAGLLVGNRAPRDAMSDQTQKYVVALWTLVDEVLNSLLFLLIGLEVLVLEPSPTNFLFAAAAIPIALLARWIAVSLALLVPVRGRLEGRYKPFLTWAGVRGGISIALALALPISEAKPIILAATYAVVLFSIVVQGLTLPAMVKRLKLPETD